VDSDRFDAAIRHLSRRRRRRDIVLGVALWFLPGQATARDRGPRLGEPCTDADRCRAGRCDDGVCTCRDGQEECRERCVREGTCCPRRRPQMCDGKCYPKRYCCLSKNRCSCNGRCIPCTECCDDGDCAGSTDECNDGVCVNRQCVKRPLPGNACGVGGVSRCSDAGLCEDTACASPAMCPGTDTECRTRTCEAGLCRFAYASSGVPVSTQVDGDCLVIVCDGAGNTTTIADDDDRPDIAGCQNPICDQGMPVCAD
jgi:hypothetical protein